MKKLITIIMAVALVFPAVAGAVTCVSEVYTLFIDADLYNRTYAAGFNYDSMVFDLIIMSDGKTAYYNKQKWVDGYRTTTDVVECVFSSDGETFKLTFPDRSVMDGYYDPDGSSLWLNLGQRTYFRFYPARRYDISIDYKKQ